MLDRLHTKMVQGRRARVLAEHLLPWLPRDARVLDVGAGDARVAALLAERRPDLKLRCIDVDPRDDAQLPVEAFDGAKIPFDDRSFDAALLIDVLHHTLDPLALLREVRRVSPDRIVLKDHALDGAFAGVTLRLMDWLGNARHGVPLPYNYWPQAIWRDAFARLGLEIRGWEDDLGVYPWPASWIFDRRLHLLAVVGRSESAAS